LKNNNGNDSGGVTVIICLLAATLEDNRIEIRKKIEYFLKNFMVVFCGIKNLILLADSMIVSDD